MKQTLKSKFRASSIWKKWRKRIYDKDHGKDYITGKKLYAGYNCHHIDLRAEHYKDLRDENRFISLNKNTHQFIHWIYDYWNKDPLIIDRIIDILNQMKLYSND